MAGNPILMLLEGNGSLVGRDRDGAFTATGSGALRYAPAEGTYEFYDRFERADGNIDGDTADSGQTWVEFHPTLSAEIQSGRLTIDPPVSGVTASYPGVILANTPSRYGGEISWSGSTGDNAACTFIVGTDDHGFAPSGFPLHMVHLVIGPTAASVEVYEHGVSGGLLATAVTAFDTSGAPNQINCSLAGDTLRVSGPDGVIFVVTDPSIGAAAGRYVIWEPYINDWPTQDRIPGFDSVYAGSKSGGRVNYAVNGSFEEDSFLGYWVAATAGTTAVQDLTAATRGSACLHGVCDGVTTQYGGITIYALNAIGYRFLRGNQVWCRFMVRGSGQVRYLLLRAYDQVTVQELDWVVNADFGEPAWAVPSEWTEIVMGPVNVPIDSVSIELVFAQHADQTGVDAFDIQIDEVMFTHEDPTGWGYFDGLDGGMYLDPVTGHFGNGSIEPSVDTAVFWVEEGTTNLVLNPSAEVNADSAVPSGASSVVTRDTTRAFFGAACYKMATTGAVAGEYVFFPTATGLALTGSARTFVGQCRLSGSGQVKVQTSAFYSDTTIDSSLAATVDLSEHWEYVEAPVLTVNAAKTVDFLWVIVQVVGQAAVTAYIDGVQIEEKAYATSYCDGSLGTGYSWAGTAHITASTRTMAALSSTLVGRLDSVEGSVLFARKELGAAFRSISMGPWTPDAGDDAMLVWHSSSMDSRVNSATGPDQANANAVIDMTVWTKLYGGWLVDEVRSREIGGVEVVASRPAPTGVWADDVFVVQPFLGSVLMGSLAFYDRPLTDAELVRVGSVIDADADLWNLLGLDEEELASRQYLMLAPFAEDSFE